LSRIHGPWNKWDAGAICGGQTRIRPEQLRNALTSAMGSNPEELRLSIALPVAPNNGHCPTPAMLGTLAIREYLADRDIGKLSPM